VNSVCVIWVAEVLLGCEGSGGAGLCVIWVAEVLLGCEGSGGVGLVWRGYGERCGGRGGWLVMVVRWVGR